MTSSIFEYTGMTPSLDLAVANHNNIASTNSEMALGTCNFARNYPPVSIPSRPLNRVCKPPSPQKRSRRRMPSINDLKESEAHGRLAYINQLILQQQQIQRQQQQQQQQQIPYWNHQFSMDTFQPSQRQSGTISSRPSSWHCSSLEPLSSFVHQPISMTPGSAISYPCNESTLSHHNNNPSSYFSTPISPEISSFASSPLFPPPVHDISTTTTAFSAPTSIPESFFTTDSESPIHCGLDPLAMDSNYLVDGVWAFDSLPLNNTYVNSPLTQGSHDCFQWNWPMTNDYPTENCPLTSPPTPNDVSQNQQSNRLPSSEGCVSSQGLSKNQPEEELIGMGLYDDPELLKSPNFYVSDDQFDAQKIKIIQRQESQGKGLKLEETFTPTLTDDDDDDDEAAATAGSSANDENDGEVEETMTNHSGD